MRRLFAFTILLTVLLAVAACGGAKSEPAAATPASGQPAAATQAPAQPAAKATAAGQAAATQAPKQAVPTAAPATAEDALPVLKKGALKSYVARIEMKTEVVQPEPALETWSEVEMTYRLDPAPIAYALVIKDKTGQGQPDTQMIVIGSDTYLQDPDSGAWMKLPTGGDMGGMMQSMLDPEEVSKDAPVDVFTAANVVSRNEMVDGVATTHYRTTEAQLRALMAQTEAETGQKLTLLSGTADFWVANKGNYLKQYRLNTLQEDEAGRQQKTALQMLVTNENKPVTIQPPPADQVTDMGEFMNELTEPELTEEAPAPEAPAQVSAALAALPAPPRSKEYTSSQLTGGAKLVVEMLEAQGPGRAFLSDASPEEVSDFYKAQMPMLGYKPVMPMPGEMGIAISMYEKGEQSVLIHIAADSETGKTLVMIQMP